MLDEVQAKVLGVLDEIIGDRISGIPTLLASVLSCGGAHGSVPHRHGELLVAQGIGAVEGGRSSWGEAHQAGFLGLAAGGAAKVEVAWGDDGFGTLVDELHRHIGS